MEIIWQMFFISVGVCARLINTEIADAHRRRLGNPEVLKKWSTRIHGDIISISIWRHRDLRGWIKSVLYLLTKIKRVVWECVSIGRRNACWEIIGSESASSIMMKRYTPSRADEWRTNSATDWRTQWIPRSCSDESQSAHSLSVIEIECGV